MAPFTAGTGNTHTCSINWGDGVVAAGAVPGRPDRVKLRPERSGPGDGRVYKVTFSGALEPG